MVKSVNTVVVNKYIAVLYISFLSNLVKALLVQGLNFHIKNNDTYILIAILNDFKYFGAFENSPKNIAIYKKYEKKIT